MKTEHKLTVIGIIVAICAIIVSAIIALYVHRRNEVVNADNRAEDARQKEHEARPRIDYVAVRYENGYTILTFKNKSPVTPVAVTRLDFTISAPYALARIKRADPPPKEFMAGRPNNIDDVGFTKGYWTATCAYTFPKDVGQVSVR